MARSNNPQQCTGAYEASCSVRVRACPCFPNVHCPTAHIACDYKERGNEAYALRLLGEIAVHCDPLDVVQAEAYYQQARTLADQLGIRPLAAHCYHGLGMLYGQVGRPEQARAELSAAIALYRAMNMTFWLPQVEVALTQIEERL